MQGHGSLVNWIFLNHSSATGQYEGGWGLLNGTHDEKPYIPSLGTGHIGSDGFNEGF